MGKGHHIFVWCGVFLLSFFQSRGEDIDLGCASAHPNSAIAARVNGQVITVSEVDALLKQELQALT